MHTSVDTVSTLMQCMHPSVDEDSAWEMARQAFQMADTNGDGVLSFDEFERAFAQQFLPMGSAVTFEAGQSGGQVTGSNDTGARHADEIHLQRHHAYLSESVSQRETPTPNGVLQDAITIQTRGFGVTDSQALQHGPQERRIQLASTRQEQNEMQDFEAAQQGNQTHQRRIDPTIQEHQQRLQAQAFAEREILQVAGVPQDVNSGYSRRHITGKSIAFLHTESDAIDSERAIEKLVAVRKELEQSLAAQAAELDNERELNRHLLVDISQRMKEVMVLLPEAKERAVMDLYQQSKKLEISRKSGAEAVAAFERMRTQLTRRVESMQTSIMQERQMLGAELASTRDHVQVLRAEARQSLVELQEEVAVQRRRAALAEETLESERARMQCLIEELVERGIAEQVSSLRSHVQDQQRGAQVAQLDMMRKVSELEEKSQEQKQALNRTESLLYEQRMAHQQELAEREEGCKWRLHHAQTRFDDTLGELRQALESKTGETSLLLAANRKLADTVHELKTGPRQLESQLVNAQAQHVVSDEEGAAVLLGRMIGTAEHCVLATDAVLHTCLSAAENTWRERAAERSFLLHSIRALGERGKQLLMQRRQCESELAEYEEVLLAAGLNKPEHARQRSSISLDDTSSIEYEKVLLAAGLVNVGGTRRFDGPLRQGLIGPRQVSTSPDHSIDKHNHAHQHVVKDKTLNGAAQAGVSSGEAAGVDKAGDKPAADSDGGLVSEAEYTHRLEHDNWVLFNVNRSLIEENQTLVRKVGILSQVLQSPSSPHDTPSAVSSPRHTTPAAASETLQTAAPTHAYAQLPHPRSAVESGDAALDWCVRWDTRGRQSPPPRGRASQLAALPSTPRS